MQRIWQGRPNRQGKGNDVREVEGRSTETATRQHCSAACAALGPPTPSDLQCQAAQTGQCLWEKAGPYSPVTQRPAR